MVPILVSQTYVCRASEECNLNGTSESTLIGLDFNPAELPSFLDIGDLAAEYAGMNHMCADSSCPNSPARLLPLADDVTWALPASLPPTQFALFVDHLAMCSQDSLMTNWSTSWQVIVDSGNNKDKI